MQTLSKKDIKDEKEEKAMVMRDDERCDGKYQKRYRQSECILLCAVCVCMYVCMYVCM